MHYLIVEDEYHAARRLKSLVSQLEPESRCLAVLDSVEDAVAWLLEHPHPDLAFLDIQLADGLSFDIFRHVDLKAPVIFTTAFNEYALRAFKTNSIDYLLKPVDEDELRAALARYKEHWSRPPGELTPELIRLLTQQVSGPEYVKRFLIKQGHALSFVPVGDIAYFYSDSGLTFLMTLARKRHNIDYTLDQLEDLLDPAAFFRINRKMILHYQSVDRAAPYFNSRLKVAVTPESDLDAVVSREKVKQFKEWLGS